jgi:hypothetical protein
MRVARAIAITQPVKAAPYFAHAQFSPPDTVLALPDPGDVLPYVKAMWHYARGIAHTARGDFTAAASEVNAIETLERNGDFSLLNSAGVPAQDVLKLARAVVQGRIAQAKGEGATAVTQFEQAATLQDTLPYMEPPYWYYPVRQTLGAALMQARRLLSDLDNPYVALDVIGPSAGACPCNRKMISRFSEGLTMLLRCESLEPAHVSVGPNPVLGAPSRHVRLAAVSGLHLDISIGRRRANSRQLTRPPYLQ